ncbi:hypothetical protein [Flindersiella endophytica]
MSKRRIAVLVAAVAVLLPLLAVAGYTATTKWLLAGPPNECDLIPRQDLEQILRSDAEVTLRSATPTRAGGWEYYCSYQQLTDEEDPGFLSVTVSTAGIPVPDVARDDSSERRRLSGLGDEAWVGERAAGMRAGDIDVRLAGSIDGGFTPGGFEQALRAISGRLETVPEFPRSDPAGVCARLDAALVERLAGTELPGRRGVVRENGDVKCSFETSNAMFRVESTTDLEGFDSRFAPANTPITGLSAKGARKVSELSGTGITFVVDGRRYDVTLSLDGEEPSMESTNLPKMVVDAFAACGDDLAGCRR